MNLAAGSDYRMLSAAEIKMWKSGFKTVAVKDDSFHQRGKEYKDTVKQ